tara:strand:+ start:411 stop:602 length:192 start_codon:yes stop_codon:yes gene_type:complete
MNIYRGYQIAKHKNSFRIIAYDPVTNVFFKTEEEAMNKIDSIERERVARDNANIQRVDNQIKR